MKKKLEKEKEKNLTWSNINKHVKYASKAMQP
jgi:hypothetical protein